MTRSWPLFAVILALLAGTGGLLALRPVPRDVPLVAPLDDMPVSLDGWVGSNEGPGDLLPEDPEVPASLIRAYRKDGQTLWTAVSYFPVQTEARRPLVEGLFDPGRGWNQLQFREVRVQLVEGSGWSIPVNLLVVQHADHRRVAILYWHQVQTRSIASDHWYRAVLVYNRLVHRRADGARVRVAAVVPDSTSVGAVVDQEKRFVRAFYPELLRSLPP